MVVRDDIGEFLGSLAQTVRQLFANRSESLVQLMDVRRLIECDVVRRLARDRTTMPDVEDALGRMTAAVAADDPAGFTDADAAFHLALVRAVGNEILNVLYDNLFSIIVDVIRVSSKVPDKPLPEAWAEHDRIYRLIRDGDEAAASDAIRRQIDESAEYLRLALAATAPRRPRRP
jgi:DNA-binding FadR family transcriptional regulator